MAIRTKKTKVHWNYFLALESDVAHLSRFIEFHEDNFSTYSIELAHLLMAAASEVDVVAKLVCRRIKPDINARNIANYASIILPAEPKLTSLAVTVPRFGLTLKPWSSWTATHPPLWWNAYNGVKHHRDTQFTDACLKHCLNSVAALFSITIYYYALSRQSTITFGDGTKVKTGSPLETEYGRRSLTSSLQPKPELFRLRSSLGDFAEENEGSIINLDQ
jgi:hypothetical protein